MISQDIRSHERFGAPILQRISEIKAKVADCKRFHGIEFQGKYQDIPVITVRIDFPVYRLANGRTRSFQREYLALNPDAPADLFKCDHDSFAAQSAQHDILYKLVEEEDMDLYHLNKAYAVQSITEIAENLPFWKKKYKEWGREEFKTYLTEVLAAKESFQYNTWNTALLKALIENIDIVSEK